MRSNKESGGVWQLGELLFYGSSIGVRGGDVSEDRGHLHARAYE